MPRHRSRTSPVSTASMKRPSPPGLLQMTASELSKVVMERARKAALHDSVGLILVGPPDMFPIKPETAQALFGLAVDRLAQHDKTTAEALRLYAALYARLEQLDRMTFTKGLSSGAAGEAMLTWLLSEPLVSAEDLQNDFPGYRRAVGKRTCHLRTLRRQHELLCVYERAHNYPRGSRDTRDQRPAWVRQHLLAMIAKAQEVPCWHPQPDLTDHDRDKVLKEVKYDTSLAQLSALVLEQLHPTTAGRLLKRLLPRPRQ